MIKSERVTNFKLTEGNNPLKLKVFARALNEYLETLELQLPWHAFSAYSDSEVRCTTPVDNGHSLCLLVKEQTSATSSRSVP
jgi:hypothetical protein